jgi:molecular chaperone IbpA
MKIGRINYIALKEDIMNTFDFRPLFHSTVGFDRVMTLLDSVLDAQTKPSSYPPYNIIKTGEGTYEIIMAIAGFQEKDLTITLQENNLVITGTMEKEDTDVEYLHKGIAGRSFEKKFQLADFIKIQNVELAHGLLTIHLLREVPEAQKPRQIPINTKDESLLIDAKKEKTS